MDVNDKVIYSYLGYKGKTPSDEILFKISQIKDAVNASVSARSVFRDFPCSISGNSIIIGDMTVQSVNLSHAISSCDRAILFAATLGIGPDRLIRKYSATDSASAAIAQAVCTEFIEAYCDAVCKDIAAAEAKNNYSCLPRFSPGYGDFNLRHQTDFMRILSLDRQAGITLTDGYMMVPTKSVTAVIGLYKTRKV